jgi:signal transduction histidine kinase
MGKAANQRTTKVVILLVLLVTAYVLFYMTGTFTKQNFPRVTNGNMNLSEWNFETNGSVLLNGEWEFYWNQLLEPRSFYTDEARLVKDYIHVPGSWNGHGDRLRSGSELPGVGYATYRLKLLLPYETQTFAMRIPTVFTAYTLYANGEKISSAGVVAPSAEQIRPQFLPQLVVLHTHSSEIELVLQVANFDHQKGGLRYPIEFGQFQDISRSMELSVGFDTLLIGSLLIMGLYHLGLFAVRKKEAAMLFFGLFCLLISLRISLLGEILLTKLIPDFSWVLEMNLEYLTATLSMPLFVLFFACLYPEESSRKVSYGFGIVTVMYSVIMAVLPTILFTKILVVMQLIIVAGVTYILLIVGRAYIRKKEGAGILLLACGIFAATIINDMLYAHELVQTTDKMSAFGLLVFIFCQSVLLSIKLSKAYATEEKLSAELTVMNSGLYAKIKERTIDLEHVNEALKRKNDELSRLERSRSHLLSNISHDLGTPLTTIQCYLEAILDGLVDHEEQRDRYLRLIHAKVIGMDRLIEDLFQLSQLEARQVTFKKQTVSTDRLMDLLFTRYELDARNAGIDYTLEILPPAGEGERYSSVLVDVERLHQMYSNLIFNAIKFTPEGGSIRVEMSDDGKRMLCRIIDTGLGIPSEDLPFVFDRFYTSNKSRNTVTGGKGLGLSISKEIVESHGGRIWVERTQLQVGTVLCFTIPVEETLDS